MSFSLAPPLAFLSPAWRARVKIWAHSRRKVAVDCRVATRLAMTRVGGLLVMEKVWGLGALRWRLAF
jgi:hypothetical protein